MNPAQPALTQTAPYPQALAELVSRCRYRPGWTVKLSDRQRDEDHGRGVAGGLTLAITTCGYDSYHPDRGESYRVVHYRIVPAATYNEESWTRWLFEQFLDVERHEAMEFFVLGDERPFAPNHGPGYDPYYVRQYSSDEARRTSFRGTIPTSRRMIAKMNMNMGCLS